MKTYPSKWYQSCPIIASNSWYIPCDSHWDDVAVALAGPGICCTRFTSWKKWKTYTFTQQQIICHLNIELPHHPPPPPPHTPPPPHPPSHFPPRYFYRVYICACTNEHACTLSMHMYRHFCCTSCQLYVNVFVGISLITQTNGVNTFWVSTSVGFQFLPVSRDSHLDSLVSLFGGWGHQSSPWG